MKYDTSMSTICIIMMFMFQVNMRPKTIVVRAFNTMGRVNASSRSIVVGSSSRRLSLASTSSADTSTLPTHLDVTKVILKRKPQSKAFRNGNQLVFSRAIDRFEGAEPKMAKIVQVLVHDDPKPVALGYGVYNPNSLYRVRILCHRFLQPQLFQSMTNSPDETTALRLVVHHHLRKAIMTRQALQLPKAGVTDTYRLINGEGDQLSGLAVDIIGKTAVVMSSAGWCQQHQTVITECLREQLPKDTTIVWKTTQNRLEQDGYEPDKDSMVSAGLDYPLSEDEMVISMENGIRYQTYPYGDGQKTGVYCDQRENRLHVAQLCQGKRVLDLCCYHGGFSLNAAINGGALQVTGVDSSEDAVVTCRQDAELNGLVGEDRIKFVRSDITTFLQESVGQSVYDVVVLDPPKLAPSANGLDKARRKYHSFNRDAIKLVAPEGGLLLTCTCSAAMTQKDGGQYFLNMVQGAALATGREVTLLRVSGAASCHTQSPIAWPAGAYLTAALFYVHPVETA